MNQQSNTIMGKEKNHSELPWILIPGHQQIGNLDNSNNPKDFIADCEYENEKLAKANADFIIVACNNYYTLMQGLETTKERIIETDADKRAKFELKLNLIKGIRELQRQYKELFNDYANATGKFSSEEVPFDAIIKNPNSAYNKATDLIDLLSKTNL